MGDDDDAGNYCAAVQNYMPDTSSAAQCQMLIYGWSDDAPVDGRHALFLFSNFGAQDLAGTTSMAKPRLAMLTAAALVRAGQVESAAAIAEEWRRPIYREDANFLEFEAALLVRLGQVDQARGLVVQLVEKLPRMEARLRQARYFQELFEEGDAWLHEGPRAARGPS
jgi:hypothetical protein